MIRELVIEDYDAYSSLRSEGLTTEPTSFWASEEEEIPFRKSRFENTLQSEFDFMLGGFEGNQLVAIAGYIRHSKKKLSHKGYIWGVYTHQSRRGLGFSKSLMDVMIKKAFEVEDVKQIVLTTRADNEAANNLYLKLGFEIYGTEPKASQIQGTYYDEVQMVKFRT